MERRGGEGRGEEGRGEEGRGGERIPIVHMISGSRKGSKHESLDVWYGWAYSDH